MGFSDEMNKALWEKCMEHAKKIGEDSDFSKPAALPPVPDWLIVNHLKQTIKDSEAKLREIEGEQ